jgi:hypothetical protein
MLSIVPPQIAFVDANLAPFVVDPADYEAHFEAAQSATLPNLDGELELFLTTAADPATRITQTGVGFDGVVELRLYPDITNLSVYGICSATLLPTGQHLLTAAHCFTEAPVEAVGAVFHMPGGNTEIFVDTAILGPGWNGNPFSTADIAVAHLTAMAPADAERFDIYRDSNELTQSFEKLGYGRSGTGLQGSILPAGTKRGGENRVDALGQALNGTVYEPGTFIANSHLIFDFDNGISANDASGFFLGLNNLGLGTLEVSTAPGDSGGPGLIDGKIAGVTSFGQGFNGFTDVLAGTKSL